MTVDVVIGICTFRRPELLLRLLHALQARDPSIGELRVEVVVVDNAPELGAEAVVRQLSPDPATPVTYVPLGAGNISAGRNETLRQAVARARYLALIDDDELPEPAWLNELLAVQAGTGADIVTGPVLAMYPPAAPGYLRSDDFYSVVGAPEGAWVGEAVSGNALIATASVDGLAFDTSLGRSGGEDQLFFRAARARGAGIYYSPRPRVHETVPAERLSVRYLVRREYRKGNTLGLLDRGRPGWPAGRPVRRAASAMWWAVSGLLAMGRGAVDRDRAAAVAGVLRVARSAGMLWGLTGRTFQLYAGPALRA